MTITVSRYVASEPRTVWDLLVDTSRWAEWGPSVTAVDPPHARIDANTEGRVRSPLGFWIPFTVTEVDEGRTWSWKVAGIPATSHSVRQAPGGCTVSFGVPLPAAPYALICRRALRRIERLALRDATP